MIDLAQDSGVVTVESSVTRTRRPRRPRRSPAPVIVLTSDRRDDQGDLDPAGRECRRLEVTHRDPGTEITLAIEEDFTRAPDSVWLEFDFPDAAGDRSVGQFVTAAQLDFVAEQIAALRARARGLGILPTPKTLATKVGRYEDCGSPDWPEGQAPRYAQVQDTKADVTAIVSDRAWYDPRPTECNLTVSFGEDSINADVPFTAIDQLIAVLTEARHRAAVLGIIPQDGVR